MTLEQRHRTRELFRGAECYRSRGRYAPPPPGLVPTYEIAVSWEPGQSLTGSTFNGMARCDALLRGWLALRLRRALMTCVTLHHGLAIVLEISWHLAEQPQHAPGSILGWLFVRIPHVPPRFRDLDNTGGHQVHPGAGRAAVPNAGDR